MAHFECLARAGGDRYNDFTATFLFYVPNKESESALPEPEKATGKLSYFCNGFVIDELTCQPDWMG
ncbi:MAG: hypothetical protein WBB01_17615 [Phormidesmis sp.]